MGVHRGGHCADESRGNGARTSLRLLGVSPLRSCVLGLRSLVARRTEVNEVNGKGQGRTKTKEIERDGQK